MIAFVVRRLLQSILVLLAVGFIAFSLFTYVGDPINNMVGQDTTLEQRAELRQRLGLDDPFLVQYGRVLANAAQGDFGISYRHRRPVAELIAERVPERWSSPWWPRRLPSSSACRWASTRA